MKSKNPGSQLKGRKRQLASRKSAAAGATAPVPEQGPKQELQDALDEESDEQELDLEGLMNPVAARSATARRMIEQYREEQALRDAIEDSIFDARDWKDPDVLQPRSGL